MLLAYHAVSIKDLCLDVVYGGDTHRAITGGESVCMQSRRDHHERFCLDQQNGTMYDTSLEEGHYNGDLARKAVRGGFLCDEPGLGKTITVLLLIL